MFHFAWPQKMKFGEKARLEYNWGSTLKETILYFFFQLIRDSELVDLEVQLDKMIYYTKKNLGQCRNELITLYKMIGYTRDIRNGRGEYTLAFMQIWVWYAYDPELAFFAFTQFVQGEGYGSWKDVKNFCHYVAQKSGDQSHPLIEHACDLLVQQLQYDMKCIKENALISLASKWTPREKTRFRWLYTKIALKLYPQFIKTAKTDESQYYAKCKAKIHLRKTLSQMNKYSYTLEHIMCNKDWTYIYPLSIPSKALCKYKLALQNKTTEDKRRSNKIERYLAAATFTHFIETMPNYCRGNTLNIGELVKTALHCHTEIDVKIVNQLWAHDRKRNTPLHNFIPIIDLSSSMERNHLEPLYNAIGLGIRASEIGEGAFKNRLIVFSAVPTWVRFYDDQSFVDKVKSMKEIVQGLNSNLKSVLKMLIKTFVTTKLASQAVKDLTLGIFSDMQADEFTKYNSSSLYNNIKNMFLESLTEVPNLLFWNVRKTTGFPALIDHKRVILMSGSNAKMLNMLQPHEEKREHISEYKEEKPYAMMLKCLNNSRYAILQNKIISKI